MTLPTGVLFYDPQVKPISTLGLPQAGAYLLFFLTGTMTPANVYADGALTTPLSQTPGATQPSCTADSAGRFNQIYLNPATIYRVQLFNILNVKLEDTDPYVPPGISNGTLTQAGTGFFYSQSGARVNRLEDRLFVGDATVNDGQGPSNPVSADWLTLWQQSVGITFGSLSQSQSAFLTTDAALAVASPSAIIAGARTFTTGQNGQNAIGIQSVAVNNSPTFTNSIWAHYAESHRANNIVNSAIGMEIDVTQRGALVGINPYVQNFGQTVAMQLASGAQQGAEATATFATNVMTITLINLGGDNGLIRVGYRVSGIGVPANTTITSFGSGTGGTGTYNLSTSPGTLTSRIVAVSPMFDNTVAIDIQANPNAFTTGINFGSNSITGTDGVQGVASPAIQFARFHGMFWFSNPGTGTSSIYSDASASIGSPQLQLGQGSLFVREQSSGGTNFQVALTTAAVNNPFAQGATTGNPAIFGALGTDTNVDLGFFCQGTGVLKVTGTAMIAANGAIGTTMTSLGPTGSHTTVQEWLMVKNPAGTVRYIPMY